MSTWLPDGLSAYGDGPLMESQLRELDAKVGQYCQQGGGNLIELDNMDNSYDGLA